MPPPTVQPVRVSLASNCSLNTGMNAEYLSSAHAAPPLAYNSQRSHAQPSRPVALAIQSVWARAVPVIPRTVCVISPLMSLPDPSPSMPMTQRSEEHTSELQSLTNLVCRLLLEKKNNKQSDL